jgi:hypothetical protein
MQYFDKIAPHLANPLVLVGFVLLLFFGIHRALIKSKLLPPVSKQASGQIVRLLLHYGLAIATLIIIGGFGLAFWQAERSSDNRPLLTRLDAESILQKNGGNIHQCLESLKERLWLVDFYFRHDDAADINIDVIPFASASDFGPDTGIQHPRLKQKEAASYDGIDSVESDLLRPGWQREILGVTSPTVNQCVIDSISDETRHFKLDKGAAFVHRFITKWCCGI